MSATELVNEIARKFIQRPDVYAEQRQDGAWMPAKTFWPDGDLLPIKRADLESHIAASRSLGHYLVDTSGITKLFAFDIDLEKTGTWVEVDESCEVFTNHPANPREDWKNRAHPSRSFVKTQMRELSEIIASTASKELDIPVAISYSGNKGVHVYCFTGPIAAKDARDGAEIVLDSLDRFELVRGNHLFKCSDTDPYTGFPNFSIEVFPKQDTINPDGFGNLMRLPLGRNLKSADPCFFIDSSAPFSKLVPVKNPLEYLQSGNPWKV